MCLDEVSYRPFYLGGILNSASVTSEYINIEPINSSETPIHSAGMI